MILVQSRKLASADFPAVVCSVTTITTAYLIFKIVAMKSEPRYALATMIAREVSFATWIPVSAFRGTIALFSENAYLTAHQEVLPNVL